MSAQPPLHDGRARSSRGITDLSEAEWRVVALLAAGHDTKGAAHELGVSPYTVRNQVASALVKMAVRTRTALVARAIVSRGLTLSWPPARTPPETDA
ncbi:response regulator transcription factor [Monashia sp. NPDC004114]